MAVALHYTNRIDAAAAVISASSAQTDLPAANIANASRSRVWRTGNSAAAEWVTIDLGAAYAITAAIILDHTLTAGDSLIKIQGNTADSWAAPAYSNTLAWAAGTIYAPFSVQTYRYWRFAFTKSAAAETRDIGRIYIGSTVTLDRDPDYAGVDLDRVDLSTTARAIGGQTYSLARATYQAAALKFSTATASLAAQIDALALAVGTVTPFFIYDAGALDPVWYAKLARKPKKANAGGGVGAYLWNTSIDISEEL